MITLTRLHQDVRSECYQIVQEDDTIGQLFVFFSHDYLFLDGYLYLNVEEDVDSEKADELADEIILWYLNHHCPMDYGQDYTSFEVNIINQSDSYLVELGDDEYYEEECDCEETNCECE